MITIGSDFSGIGAFNQALNRLGIKYDEKFACDMDKYARSTFVANYGQPVKFPMDVYQRKIPKESLDVYMTSPPCQSFSTAGVRAGKLDPKGVLFFNSHEFIQKNKPRYFIFENVRGLHSDNDGQTFQEWLTMLGGKSVNGLPVLFPYEDSVPYHVYWKLVNSKNHNIPQSRERMFIVGIRDEKDNVFRWAKDEYLTKSLKDILETDVPDKYYLSEKMLKHLDKHPRSRNFITANEKFVGCIMANYSKQSSDLQYITEGNNKVRRLTPRECLRLMDFPENFTWSCSDTQLYKQIGNSIVVKCLELIIKSLNLGRDAEM